MNVGGHDLSKDKFHCFRKGKPRAIGGHKATGPIGIAGLPKKQRCSKNGRHYYFFGTLPAFLKIQPVSISGTGFFCLKFEERVKKEVSKR